MEKREKEKYISAFVTVFGACLICFLPLLIINGGRFFYYGDYNKQQITFYTHMIDTVRQGSLAAWDPLADLGSDTAASYSFYLLGSPFFWLMTLFPSRLAVTLMPLFIALKSGIAAVGAYGFARIFVKNTRAAFIASTLYGLSAFGTANVIFNHFHDAMLILPFMLWALERLVRDGRHGFFALTVAVGAFTNYYFFFGQALFILIYFVTALITGHFRLTPKRFGALALEAVLGVMLAAVLLLPSAMSVIDNPRLSSSLSGLGLIRYEEPSTYLFILKNLLLPPDITLVNNFGMSTAQSSGCFAGAFCVIPLCGVIAYFRTVRGRDHFKLLITVCTVIMFVPVLNQAFSLFNTTFYGRWFYMPALISAVMTARAAELWAEDGECIRKGLLPAGIITGCAAAVSLAVTLLAANGVINLGFDNFAYAYAQPIFALAVFAFIALPVLKPETKDMAVLLKQLMIRTAVFAGAGMCLTVWCAYIVRGTSESYTMNSVFELRENDPIKAEGFYRTSSEANLKNMPVIWGHPTVRYFSSTVEPTIMSFYDSLGMERSVRSDYEISEYPLMSLLSVRYYADQAYFDDDGNALPPFPVLPGSDGTYTLLCQQDDINIYENTEFLPMGLAYDCCTTKEALSEQPPLMREYAYLEALVLDGEQISRYSDILTEYDTSALSDAADRYHEICEKRRSACCTSFEMQGSRFDAEITLDTPSLVLFSVPYSEGWIAEVNGQPARAENADSGLMAVKCEAGKSSITFTYKNKYSSAGLIMTISAAGALTVYLVLCRVLSQKSHKKSR